MTEININEAAAEMGRKGGAARMACLNPEERSALGATAATVRWHQKGVEAMRFMLDAVRRGHLSVDSEGRVWTYRYRGLVRPARRAEHPMTNGYLCVGIVRTKVLAHRLVWHVINGPILLGLEVNHIDGNRANNNPTNLELTTRLENARHAKEVLGHCHGAKVPSRGTDHGLAKLDDERIRQIRKLVSEGMTAKEAAEMFGVTRQNIGFIVRRQTWTHVVD